MPLYRNFRFEFGAATHTGRWSQACLQTDWQSRQMNKWCVWSIMNASRSLHSLTFNRPQRCRCPGRLGVCVADRPTRPKCLIIELETPEVGGATTQEPIVSVFITNHGGALRRSLSWKKVSFEDPTWEFEINHPRSEVGVAQWSISSTSFLLTPPQGANWNNGCETQASVRYFNSSTWRRSSSLTQRGNDVMLT